MPAFEGDEGEVRLLQQRDLCLCDAVLLYYGAGNDLWMRSKLREVQKSPGFGRRKKLLAEAIYVASPATPEKERISIQRIPIFHETEGFEPSCLEPFISQLERAKAKAAG